jgi:hypothetical protein
MTNQDPTTTIWRAFLEGPSFVFEGYGLTLAEARRACEKGLKIHDKTYDSLAGWWTSDDIGVAPFLLGEGYRDRERLTERCARCSHSIERHGSAYGSACQACLDAASQYVTVAAMSAYPVCEAFMEKDLSDWTEAEKREAWGR